MFRMDCVRAPGAITGGIDFRHFRRIFDRAGMNVDPIWMNVDQIWMSVDPIWMKFDPIWMNVDPIWINIHRAGISVQHGTINFCTNCCDADTQNNMAAFTGCCVCGIVTAPP